MYKHKLTVYREDLNVGQVLTGGTEGAIELLLIAAGSSVVIAAESTMTITHCDTEDGEFTSALVVDLTAGTYAKGDIIAKVTLPSDIKAWAKATVSGNTGDVVVKQSYLPR